VQQILDVTERLVPDIGYDSITTNLIARESGVPIGTLYHYYSNKFGIFSDIVRRSFAELESKWKEQPVADPASEPIEDYFDCILDMMAEHWRHRRAAMQLWSILQHTPEMRAVTDRFLRLTTERNARTIAHYFPELPPARRKLAGMVMEEAGSALLNRLNTCRGAQRNRLREEMKTLIRAYLGTLRR
jgi:AcrR family transcriptional regulator